nr:hypothetical protein Iba_chr01eCG7690 [Ipomoea batatas]
MLTFLSVGKLRTFKYIAAANDDENISSCRGSERLFQKEGLMKCTLSTLRFLSNECSRTHTVAIKEKSIDGIEKLFDIMGGETLGAKGRLFHGRIYKLAVYVIGEEGVLEELELTGFTGLGSLIGLPEWAILSHLLFDYLQRLLLIKLVSLRGCLRILQVLDQALQNMSKSGGLGICRMQQDMNLAFVTNLSWLVCFEKVFLDNGCDLRSKYMNDGTGVDGMVPKKGGGLQRLARQYQNVSLDRCVSACYGVVEEVDHVCLRGHELWKLNVPKAGEWVD